MENIMKKDDNQVKVKSVSIDDATSTSDATSRFTTLNFFTRSISTDTAKPLRRSTSRMVLIPKNLPENCRFQIPSTANCWLIPGSNIATSR